MTRRGVTRRELLAGGVLVGVGAAAANVARSDATADAASAVESTAFAGPAEHPAGRLGTHRVIWSVPNNDGLVGLTFDDGPCPAFTARLLEILREYRVTATFNVVGVRAARYRSLLADIVAAGHQLGNHTDHHLDLSAVPPPVVRREIMVAQDTIEQYAQAPVTVFRPPRGELTGAAAREAAVLGLDVLMWSITRDVAGVGNVKSVIESLSSRTGAGDIVALHDGLGHAGFAPRSPMAHLLRQRRNVEVHALPQVLASYQARGLRCVSVQELLAATSSAGGGNIRNSDTKPPPA